jgi:LmbE family N-acetylglucosaminyl deacetylase
MQKILFGIFAHPDDEAFGPVATLVKEVQNGTELHLILLTAGENGVNVDNVPNLAEVRMQEWQTAGKLIGASSMTHLGYEDGTLNNLNHLEIAVKINELVTETVDGRENIEIEFMSLELNGYTGHIDHIVAGRSACLAFYQLRDAGKPMKRVRLACLTREEVPEVNTSFVFMEPGKTSEEIAETIDGRENIDKIHEIMRAHHSQHNDYEIVTKYKGDKLGIDHFLIRD